MRPGRSAVTMVLAMAGAAGLSACFSNGATSTTAATLKSSSTSTTGTAAPDPAQAGPGFTIPQPPPAAPPWTVETSSCLDPAAANAQIGATLTIGTTAPQSGGLVSVIYAPVVAGFRAFIDKANAEGLLGGVTLEVVVADDEGRTERTPVAVAGLLEAGADVVSAIAGTANNLSVRELLNDNCVPQLMSLSSSPLLGEVGAYPWTMGGVVSDVVETTVYANVIARSVAPDAPVALLVSNDDAGRGYATAFVAAASDTELAVVDQQFVEPNIIDAPVAQLLDIAAREPKAIVASLTGVACVTFLTELDRVRSTRPGWAPAVYLASECADESVLRLAGAAADGVISSANLVAGPDFVARMQALGIVDGFGRAAQGWTAAEVSVAILVQAQRSPAGLTRASIIEAARGLSYAPSLALPGVEYTTNGSVDAFAVESLQIVRFDAGDQRFTDVGALVAQFES